MASASNPILEVLRLIAHRLGEIHYPRLTRPRVPPDQPPTRELVNWGIQAYCLPWVKHFGVLISGIVVLNDAGNRAAIRIVGRSSYELCAHVYYVKKHLKQSLDRSELIAAWKFLTPIATGSRYISEQDTEINRQLGDLFPPPAHISKAIKCFKEVMPKDSQDDYSYLSEFCHPNLMAFMQHYQWTTPETIEMIDAVPFGALGAIAGSAIQGLLALNELLEIGNERTVRKSIHGLLRDLAAHAKRME